MGERVDGSSLSGVESAALTQGIAFLYGQAGELLRRRREARDRAGGRGAAPAPGPLPALELPEGAFEPAGAPPPAAAPDVLDRVADGLLRARRDVDDYVVGTADLGGAPSAGLEAADRLRRLLEEVYGADVTFRGERRPADRGAAALVQAPQAGVVLAGNVHVTGDIAGRDIHKKA